MIKKPELLIPAGDMEKLKYAIAYGADAVYIGGKDFSLRERAVNFDIDEIKEAVEYTHNLGKKLYIAVNIFPRNNDIERIEKYLKNLNSIKVDAIIVSDPGVIKLAKQNAPDLKLHLSTQSNNTNYMSALYWKDVGIKRIVLARELSLKEIKEITENVPDMEFEIFVHGAMCMSYSGRCMLSSFLTARDANKGECSHPCRWSYALLKEKNRIGQALYVEEDDKGTYLFSPKDLNMIEYISEIINAGVSSLKVEGRVKTLYYVSQTARVYRKAIDTYNESNIDKYYKLKLKAELEKVNNRGYNTGFYLGNPTEQDYRYESDDDKKHYYLGRVLANKENNVISIIAKNKINKGDKIEILFPDLDKDISCEVKKIIKVGICEENVNVNQEAELVLDKDVSVEEYCVLRKMVSS